MRDAADRDDRQFVLADGCADRDPEIHDFLCTRVFPRRCTVLTSDALRPALAR